MKHFKHTVPFLFVLMLALIFIGCAKPPDAEKAAAQTAMNAAKSAGADKYAPIEMEAGTMLWKASEEQLKAEKFEEAKVGYMAAKSAFDKAVKTATTAKQALIAEVNATITSMEEGWKALEANALAIEKKMKDQKEAWDADALLFTEGLKTARGMIATDLAGAKAKAGEMKAIIDKWNVTIQELAAAPEKPAKKGKK